MTAPDRFTPRALLRVAKKAWHDAKYGVEAEYDLFDPVAVIPFRSWGTSRSLRVQGRVLEQAAMNAPDRDSGVVENTANTLRRLESDEIPGARVNIAFRGREQLVTADDEGFFRVDFESDVPLDGGWHRVGLKLVESMAGSGSTATAEVYVPDPDAERVVISDIDDTVMITRVNEPVEMAWLVAGGNARTRRPFAGVPELYRALARGASPHGNAIFYVTRSGWNFYDLVTSVLDLHEIPRGPMLMRDMALVESRAASLSTDEQKLSKIAEVIETFPEQRFVLIGDSGQADASIYAECASRYGRRIEAVYIRRVNGPEVERETAERIRAHAGALCITGSTAEMARHAAARGIITAADLEEVLAAEAREERA